MTSKLTLVKIRGTSWYSFRYSDEVKSMSWSVDPKDIPVETLRDIINTVHPPLQPTVPAIPIHPGAEFPQLFAPAIQPSNTGAEAADRAAREEEMRLRNMGSAISRGIGLGPDDIPVVDVDRNDLPDPNWSL